MIGSFSVIGGSCYLPYCIPSWSRESDDLHHLQMNMNKTKLISYMTWRWKKTTKQHTNHIFSDSLCGLI